MNLVIQNLLMDELIARYENFDEVLDPEEVEPDEAKKYSDFYHGLFLKLSTQRDQRDIADFSQEEVKDIWDEVDNIETSFAKSDRQLSREIRLFYIQNGFVKKVTLDQLKNMLVYSSSTGRYSMVDHFKYQGGIYILKDRDELFVPEFSKSKSQQKKTE